MTDQMPTSLPDAVKDTGIGLTIGAIGGSAYYFIKGLRNSPKGHRLAAGAQAVRTNAPSIGRLGDWFGLQSAIDVGMEHVNKKGDPLNTQISFGAASALVSMRRGPHAAAISGLKGAALGGLIEIALYGLRKLEVEDN